MPNVTLGRCRRGRQRYLELRAIYDLQGRFEATVDNGLDLGENCRGHSQEWLCYEIQMSKSAITFDTVRKLGLKFPNVEESTAYGQPALKIHGKLMACLPSHRSAEPNSLAVRVDFADRAELLAAAPEIYYITDHYVDYNAVLVRLSRVSPEVLRDLLGMAHKFVTRKVAPRSPAGKRRKSGPRK